LKTLILNLALRS